MDVITKDAAITNTDDAFPGSFRVALSVPTKDRDGDTLGADEWKQPLPDHITFDQDHLMSVAGTVGSGRPWIDTEGREGAGKGALIVEGTYSSLPRAQEVRTLVKEGHIKTTSVAFMTERTQKDGKATVVRELLNGAFVAVPSNREAVVLDFKGLKAGRRNSKTDQAHLDAIARHAAALGATFHSADDQQGGDTDADEDVAAGKTVSGETVLKDTDNGQDAASLVQSIDAALDQIPDLLAGVDVNTLPAGVQQALSLAQAAGAVVDELMDATGIPDPDEDVETAPETATAEKAAAADAAAEAERIDMFKRAVEKRLSPYLSERN